MGKHKKIEEAIKLYESGKSVREIESIIEIPSSTIYWLFRKYGFNANRYRTSDIICNKDFFGSYTAESCYWAGFILADGSIRYNRNSMVIKLAKRDKDHLRKFFDCINCKEYNRIRINNNTCRIELCISEYIQDLAENFDIFPRKTFTAEISCKLPVDFLSHYIRGYFDGDGSISIKNGKYYNISFAGTISIIEYLRHWFYNNCNIRIKSDNKYSPIRLLNGNTTHGQIYYTCENARTILNYMYKDSDDLILLDRKYRKFKQLSKDLI